MGKKVKVGKQRRDKYYRLAKEAGLRSRAVFKLTQLNRKFEFLQKSQVLIDLCAAPGGWLQVASKNMPTSSLIIGVDLAPIKALPNVITLQNDITTESCRQAIKGNLQTWLADCVLHDGAPNVGKNWGHDAFMQAQLTLSALRLATEVLKRGGWFITKIFRSPDYPALVDVFKKLFKKVFVTKPEASRSESSEIYAVCRYYLKPDKVDPKLLDPKFVFLDANLEPEKPKLNLMKPEKRKKRAEGYAEGATTLHHSYMARQFVETDKHLELLADAHVIRLDGEENLPLAQHPATSGEIRECCADIKVLGRRELRELLNWRKTLRQHLQSLKPKTGENAEEKQEEEVDEEVELDNFVNALKTEEERTEKKKRKKLMAEKRSMKQKLDLKMVIPGDRHDFAEEADLFSLKKARNKERTLGEMDVDISDSDNEQLESDVEGDESSSEIDFDDIGDIPEQMDARKNNKKSLLVDFDGDEETKTRTKTDAWFEKDIFNDLVGDDDEDADIERAVAKQKRKLDSSKTGRYVKKVNFENNDKVSDIEKYSSEEEDELDDNARQSKNLSSNDQNEDDGFEVVSHDYQPENNKKLDGTGMALAELWIHSSKTRRDLIESGYNRYTNNDENLPAWFVGDEKRHYRPLLPITKEAVEAYKLKLKEINARPIKKAAQAKARKKKRGVRRAEKAKKRTEAVIENSDMTEAQKAQEVRKIYKQSMTLKKKEVTYVVAKKSAAGKRVHRPTGVKGRFKVVDKRLKKDRNSEKRKEAGAKKGGPKRKR